MNRKPLTNGVAGDATYLMVRLWEDFPGLRDGESEINGGDMVEAVAGQLAELDELRLWLQENVEVCE